MHVLNVQAGTFKVLGPRYWQHDVATEAGQDTAGAGDLAAAPPAQAYVQRRGGALSYAADPSGLLSLLHQSLGVRKPV